MTVYPISGAAGALTLQPAPTTPPTVSLPGVTLQYTAAPAGQGQGGFPRILMF